MPWMPWVNELSFTVRFVTCAAVGLLRPVTLSMNVFPVGESRARVSCCREKPVIVKPERTPCADGHARRPL